jgi:hypothetical protein
VGNAAVGRHHGGAFTSAELVLTEGAVVGGGHSTYPLHTPWWRCSLTHGDKGGGCLLCSFSGPHGGGAGAAKSTFWSCSFCFPSLLMARWHGVMVDFGGGHPMLGRGTWLCRRVASGEVGYVGIS